MEEEGGEELVPREEMEHGDNVCTACGCQTSGDERRRVMSVLGPPIIKQQLQYLSDEDEDAGEIATEPIKVRNVETSFSAQLSTPMAVVGQGVHRRLVCLSVPHDISKTPKFLD